MAIGSQCGEDAIFAEIFGTKRDGFVVDVGAADGQDNSNSWNLINQGWGAILIEPDPEQYAELENRYVGNSNVITMNMAVGTQTGIKPFYTCRQVSTLSTEWRDTCIDTYDVDYKETTVTVLTLQFILDRLQCPKEFDLLTIDCESYDVDVLESLDLAIYKPKIICLECAPPSIEGYSIHSRTCGNTIFMRD